MVTLLEGLITMNNYEKIFKAAQKNDRETFRKLFFRLHLKDQEELYHALYQKNKRKIEDLLSPNEFAELFEWMSPRDQKDVYNLFSPEYVARLFPYMEIDNIVRFLSYLNQEENIQLLELLSVSERNKIEEMLVFEPESAGSIMNKNYIIGSANQTIKQITEHVRIVAHTVETVYYIYILDEKEMLIGVISLRDLILHPEEEILANVMVTKLAFVPVNADQETAAHLLQKYDLVAVPVLDKAGRMLGIITVDDVMDIMSAEVTEDFNDFAAIGKRKKKEVDEGSTWDSARIRMPWIIILIFLGIISASLISSFEETLNEVVLLAAFIPIIMDSAGNVGTQSLAVAVRKLSLGEKVISNSFWKIIWRESIIGIILGSAAGIVLGLVVAVFYGNPILGLVIGVSLLITLSISNVVGAVIPVLINKMHIDPAIASGPFITTINDAVGLFIYFTIATQFLHLL